MARRRPGFDSRTHRGCRAGAHTRRRFVQKQTGVNTTNLLTIKPVVNILPSCVYSMRDPSVNKADFIIDYVADHDIDVLCITETWLQRDNTAFVSAITPRGYLFEDVARSNHRGGGVGVLYRASLTLDHSQLWPASSFECIDIELRRNSIPSTLRLFVIYPAITQPHSQPFATFLTEFRHLAECVGTKAGIIIIIGYVNVVCTVRRRRRRTCTSSS